MNVVRPYTYQHYQSLSDTAISNATHYNQPMAHPLGAGFAELIATARYQPVPRLAIDAKVMYYKQGIDTGNSNNGSNIFLDYNTRPGNYGVDLINGPEASCVLFSLNASYEIRPRLYFDVGGTYRKFKVEQNLLPEDNTLYFSAGLRLNLGQGGLHRVLIYFVSSMIIMKNDLKGFIRSKGTGIPLPVHILYEEKPLRSRCKVQCQQSGHNRQARLKRPLRFLLCFPGFIF